MLLGFNKVDGLPAEEFRQLFELTEVFNYHQNSNETKQKYYDGKIRLQDVNLGIALPKGLKNLSVGCEWGAKTVDVLASRSMFDGFVSDGDFPDGLSEIVERNSLISQYNMACKDELKFGCTFATLSADGGKAKIRFHSPQTASGLWNGEKGRLDCGLVVIDSVRDEKDAQVWTPSHLNLYTDTDVWEILKDGHGWRAVRHPHAMGIPLCVPFIWDGTSAKPFGRGRLKAPIRALIDGYIRTIANAAIALEFDTTPQKYILGVTDEQYDAIVGDKFRQYVGSILAATTNPETGQNPVFGQLPQGSLQPHIEMLRMLATQFSAATGLSVTDTGVINDANPTSSDAILAQSQTLVRLAEDLNQSNGEALKKVALMALAIERNVSYADVTESIMPHFKNPAMPSVAVTADAAIKIAAARQGFASTDIFLEMVGFSQADITRIKSQERRARGLHLLEGLDDDIE